MMKYIYYKNDDDYLEHHGIPGMHWGIRRYQNKDGSLTSAGKIRYRDNGDGTYTKRSRSERKEYIKEEQRRAEIEERNKRHQEYKNYLKEHKQEFLDSAKEEEMWNIDFIEFTQNDVRNNDVKWLLKEYSKFLDDPDVWLEKYRTYEKNI